MKTTGQSALAAVILLCLLETVFRLAGQAPGTNRFAERVLLGEHLGVKKPKGEFRIFTFGESTMHGAHYGPTSSPARWLEKYLEDYLPDQNIRVINFARIGRGIDFAYRTLKEVSVYQPDLVLVYTGHNVFLDQNRKAEVERRERMFRRRLRHWQKKSVFFSSCYRWVIQEQMRSRGARLEDQMEFPVIETAPLRYGPDQITPRQSPIYLENTAFFKEGIRSIKKWADDHAIPILFLKPVSNLKDFAPYYSLHLKPLSPAELSRWKKFYREGRREEVRGDFRRAQAAYREAEEIDDTYADLSFRLGQLDFRNGNFEKAREHFEQARDNDAVIFRATRETLEAFRDLVREENLQLWDTETVLAPYFPGGIPGEPLVEDNVHFSIEGQARMARGVAREIARRNWIAPRGRWQFQRERPFQEMEKELGIGPGLLFSADLKMVHYFGSRFPNRVRFARKALAIRPRDPRALRHLAWTYWLMGRRGRALKVYALLKQVDPQSFNEIFFNLDELKKKLDNYGSNPLMESLEGIIKNGFMGRPK